MQISCVSLWKSVIYQPAEYQEFYFTLYDLSLPINLHRVHIWLWRLFETIFSLELTISFSGMNDSIAKFSFSCWLKHWYLWMTNICNYFPTFVCNICWIYLRVVENRWVAFDVVLQHLRLLPSLRLLYNHAVINLTPVTCWRVQLLFALQIC